MAYAMTLAMIVLLTGQQNPFGDLGSTAERAKPAEAVRYLYPEQVSVVAGKATAVALHFSVKAGLHINSHMPSEKDLIATVLTIPASSGVTAEAIQFPAGREFVLAPAGPDGPSEKLNVYTGEFVVNAELRAVRGEHLVEGSLRYQACDNRACMPPHTIPVVVDVIAR